MQICDIVALIVVVDAHLNAVAVHVRHNNVSLRINRYVAGIIKFTIAVTERTELE